MELDFSDIQQRAVIRRMSGQEYIRIIVWKPISGVFRGFVSLNDVEMVFKWSDISDVMDSVTNYLESEGFYGFGAEAPNCRKFNYKLQQIRQGQIIFYKSNGSVSGIEKGLFDCKLDKDNKFDEIAPTSKHA